MEEGRTQREEEGGGEVERTEVMTFWFEHLRNLDKRL